MEKLSGLLLDVYDDQEGEVFRQVYPTKAEVPSMVKNAHMLSGEERSSLPDDLFALVMRDGDVVLRKYACTDVGNTRMSIDYFLQTMDRLPEEAQKVAAANLLVACDWYKLDHPKELKKVAGIGSFAAKIPGMIRRNPGKALGAGMTALGVAGAASEIGGNLKGVNAQEAGRGFGNAL